MQLAFWWSHQLCRKHSFHAMYQKNSIHHGCRSCFDEISYLISFWSSYIVLLSITEIEHFVQKWKFLTDVVFMKVFQKTMHHNCVMSLVVTYARIRFMGKLTTFIYTNISRNGVLLPVNYSNGILGQHPGLRRNSSLQNLAQ